MYDDYDDEQFLGAESIVTLPEDTCADEGQVELAFEAMEALEQNAWARHAWRANARAHERLLEDSGQRGVEALSVYALRPPGITFGR